MHYYLIIALQAFCLYHMYKNKSNFYWIWLIVFLPVVGSLVYLFTHVFNKRDVDKIQNEITGIINPTKNVKDLEQKVRFADTFQNRYDLAEAYFQMKDISTAKEHFLKAKNDYNQNDYYVVKKLISCSFLLNDYNEVILYAEQIKNSAEFQGSNEQFLYGLSLEAIGKPDEAEAQIVHIDKRYSNYEERLDLVKFYLKYNKEAKAKALLNEIYTEAQHMTKPNRKRYKSVITEVEKLLATV